MRARAFGGFFALGTSVYYGEYPLSFAASVGEIEIMEFLLKKGVQVNEDCDVW